MASCDDDFSILGDETPSHHSYPQHHQHPSASAAVSFSTHRYIPKASMLIHRCPLPLTTVTQEENAIAEHGDHEGYDEAFAPAVVNSHTHCFADDGPGSNPFDLLQPATKTTKGRPRDDLSDGESPYSYTMDSKRSRPSSAAPSSSGDCRKDREEWSDSAIECLLDAYTEKYIQLSRGNLRGRDWEDVATAVSDRCEKQRSGKTVEQCKNKVDNLKKRYKVECQRLSNGCADVIHWPWFKNMELLVGCSSSKAGADEDKAAAVVDAIPASRQMKSYLATSPGLACLTSNFKLKSLSNPRWKRVVLKISGAVLGGCGPRNVDPKVMMLIAREVAMASRVGVEVAIVVGYQNFFCSETWVAATGTNATSTYHVGMMASAMNAILLEASFEKIGVETRVQTMFMMREIAEAYNRRRAICHLEKGRIVIFGGIGAETGNPLFTTDTAAALRASEINANAVLKGSDTDGVYARKNSSAFEHISFRELASRGFSAMDLSAVTLCEENSIPVVLFNLKEPGNISRALCGYHVGTLVDQSGRIS